MSLRGSRGVVRASKLPTCSRQAAIVAAGEDEVRVYQRLTGEPFPGEYGERHSARRRGSRFERSAFENNAHGLRHSLGPRFGYDPDDMWVRDLADEIPGPPHQMHAMRLNRMSRILRDLAAGKRVPELVVQPQLRLTIQPDEPFAVFIAPDACVLDPAIAMYVPVELKSFVEREGVTDRADLDGARRQAGVEVRALQELAGKHGVAGRVRERAIFVFATPYGLRLGPPHDEQVHAACREVDRGVAVVAAARVKLAEITAREGATSLENVLDEFPTDYGEGCHGACVLADLCREAAGESARLLGDDAAQLVGPDLGLDRIVALSQGDAPRDAVELALAADLVGAAGFLDALESRAA